jgi:hypothetical protein
MIANILPQRHAGMPGYCPFKSLIKKFSGVLNEIITQKNLDTLRGICCMLSNAYIAGLDVSVRRSAGK